MSKINWEDLVRPYDYMVELATEIAFLENAHLHVDMTIVANQETIAEKLSEVKAELTKCINSETKEEN